MPTGVYVRSDAHKRSISAGLIGRAVTAGTRQQISTSNLRHGHARTHMGKMSPTYNTWRGMIGRCLNPHHDRYSYYGALGVSVCAQWRRFAGFLADMGLRPEGMSLDRIDPRGHYEPTNCRWATSQQQRHNRR